MNQQQPQKSIFQDAATTLEYIIVYSLYTVWPLRLLSRKLGTVGASIWFPGLIIGGVIMLLFAELSNGHASWLPWTYCWGGQFVLIGHVVLYLRNHKIGRPIHRFAVGEPWFGTTVSCDCTFAVILAIGSFLKGDPGFGFWWLANVPLTIYAHGYINMRDSARKRMIVSDQLERQYWLSMLEEEDDVD